MFLKKIPINIVLLILPAVYYLFFINKGIVIYDEGYYAHISERILNGEIPYKDFFLQFTPGYFYLLALFYKILGTSVLAGRILTFVFSLGIVWLALLIVDRFKADIRLKILSIGSIMAFGFPLINNPSLLAWASVFLSLLIVFFFLQKKYILLGIVLSLILFTKQNLGIYFFILTNIFIFFLDTKKRWKNILLVNSSFLFLTLVWFSYFFLVLSSLDKFFELIGFNSRYLLIYSFSYPPLSFLVQPAGFLKLLPYYLPIVFAIIVFKKFFDKKRDLNILYLSAISLVGFFGTIYPTSDLLHVYPFFGLILVSSVLFFRESTLWRILVLILIGTGFYLSLFREYYRYQAPYRYQKFKTEIPRAKNIYIDEPQANELSSLKLFFLINSRKEDSVICYPFCPMTYFILERKNPTRYANYYPGYLTKEQEKEVVNNIKENRVKYIVTFLDYKFDTVISKFIQNQREVFRKGQFRVFEVR